MLGDVDVVFAAEHMSPRTKPLAMLTMKKALHGFLFLCMYMVVPTFTVLRSEAFRALDATKS